MRIQTIHPAEVRRWWSFARPLIQDVFTICREHQIPEDVYVCLQANRALLHVLFVDEKPTGILVTEQCGDPDNRYLNVWIMHFVQNVDAHRVELLAWVDGFAKASGLNRVRFQSPRAWSQLLKGAFKEKAVIFEREI